MEFLEIALPITLLVLAFLLKLLIDRTASLPYLVDAFLELPVDIAFLSTSFVVAFTISTPNKVKEGLLTFAIYIIGSIFVLVLWRRSSRSLEKEKIRRSIGLTSLNYLVCITALVISIQLIIGRELWK